MFSPVLFTDGAYCQNFANLYSADGSGPLFFGVLTFCL